MHIAEISKESLTLLLCQVDRIGLSIVQRGNLKKILRDTNNWADDSRFEDEAEISEIMQEEFTVLAGVTISTSVIDRMFLQFNCINYCIARLKRELDNAKEINSHQAVDLLDLIEMRYDVRSKLITGNMGLVLAMARHVNYPGVEYSELVSEGSLALMRSIDQYDYSRGFKFSTYACRAIVRNMTRAAKNWYKYRNRFSNHADPGFDNFDQMEELRQRRVHEMVEEVKTILQDNLADLTKTERTVLNMRFPIDQNDDKPMTLKGVGEVIGLSKERIRQIQNRSLQKLRLTAQERMTIMSM